MRSQYGKPHHGVLIETYWNVKIFNGSLNAEGDKVLIETYWNVKVHTGRSVRSSPAVLIETYWNVKSNENFYASCKKVGINRNILECKVMYVTVVFAQMEY